MNQNTAKNLRDLLLKQQQSAKIKFKADPTGRSNPSPLTKTKQVWSIHSNGGVQQSNNCKATTSQTKKALAHHISPALYVKKQNFVPSTNNTKSSQSSQLSNSVLRNSSQHGSENQNSKRAEVKSTSNSISISAHQSPNRSSDKQLVLQQLFLQKQLQSHMISLQQPIKIRGESQDNKDPPPPKEQTIVKDTQAKTKPIFYQHMESYLNNYYQRPVLGGQKQQANTQTQIKRTQGTQRSIVLNVTNTKLKKTNHSKAESMTLQQVESAPVSPKFQKEADKKRNKSIYELNEKTQQTSSAPKQEAVNKAHFKFIYVIGKGGFGRVWKVEMKKTRKLYAMKEMSKAKIIQKRSVNSVLNERYLLEHLYHPFLVNMSYSFFDRENLYLVMDLLTGGDLRFHLGKMRRFSENQTSISHNKTIEFFVACILLPLTYLHQNGIIHRDLKPENLVLDDEGYMRLTDLGIARINKGNNAGDTSGTPGYMAPEVMCKMDHSILADYYALGVITYEMMLGKRPYNGRSRQEIREQIMARQVQVKKEEIPPGWSDNAVDFINRLIQRKPEKRLGQAGIEEVFEHPWLKNYPWDQLINKQIKGMYVPGDVDDNADFQNQISEETQLNEEQISENQLLLRRPTVQALFEGYTFDQRILKLQHQQTQKNSQRSIVERQESSQLSDQFS